MLFQRGLIFKGKGKKEKRALTFGVFADLTDAEGVEVEHLADL